MVGEPPTIGGRRRWSSARSPRPQSGVPGREVEHAVRTRRTEAAMSERRGRRRSSVPRPTDRTRHPDRPLEPVPVRPPRCARAGHDGRRAAAPSTRRPSDAPAPPPRVVAKLGPSCDHQAGEARSRPPAGWSPVPTPAWVGRPRPQRTPTPPRARSSSRSETVTQQLGRHRPPCRCTSGPRGTRRRWPAGPRRVGQRVERLIGGRPAGHGSASSAARRRPARDPSTPVRSPAPRVRHRSPGRQLGSPGPPCGGTSSRVST